MAEGVSTNQVQACVKWSCDCVSSVLNLPAICGTMTTASADAPCGTAIAAALTGYYTICPASDVF